MFTVNKLKISGFKSFAHPTELLIEDGVTGIVGPNGCGKSNIFEAIRWVMGESSSKSLRSGSMDDVIFNGTQNTPAKNFAEVVIELDNFCGELPNNIPIEKKILISRTIERGVGSFYKINNKDVRAKDISLLFYDSGSGPRSSSIISQGNIDQIINSKPIDRKIILEDAAGTSGLQARRHESELKLLATEDNLEKIDINLSNLIDQKRDLSRQARQAEKYEQISEDIKYCQSIIVFTQWKSNSGEIKEMENKKISLDQEIKEIIDKLSTADKRNEIEKEKKLSFSKKKENLNQEFFSLNGEINKYKNQLEGMNNKKEEVRRFLNTIKNDKELEQTRYTKLKDYINELNQNMLKHPNTPNKKKKLTELASQEINLKNELKRLETIYVNEMQLSLGEEFRSDNLKENKEMLQRKASELKQNIADITKTMSIHENEYLSKKKSKQIIEDNIKKLHDQISFKKRTINETNIENNKITIELEKLTSEIEISSTKLTQIETELKTLNLLTNDSKLSNDSIVNLLKIRKGYENAVYAALTNELDATLNNHPKRWVDIDKRNIDKIQNNLSKYVNGPKELELILSQIGFLENEESALEKQKDLSVGQSLVDKKGCIWRWDGFISEDNLQKKKLIDAQFKIKKLIDEKNKYHLTLDSLQTKRINLQKKQSSFSKILIEENKSLEKVYKDSDSSQSELSIVKEKLSINKFNIDDLKNKLTNIQKENNTNLNELESLKKKEISSNKNDNSKKEKEEVQRNIEDLDLRIDKKRNEINSLKEQIMKDELDETYFKNDKKKTEAQLLECQRQIETLKEREISYKNEDKKLDDLPQSLKDKINHFQGLINEVEKKISINLDHENQVLKIITETEKEINNLNGEREYKVNERTRIDSNLENLKSKDNELRDLIFQRSKIQPEKIEEDLNKNDKVDENYEEVKTKLDKLIFQREQMGPVNLRAKIEENIIAKSIEELELEKHDLTEAIEKLRIAINKINKEGKNRLLKAYEQVNDNFSDLFKRLFNGGEARLELIKSDDPLHTGIEIYARPPGKKLSSISLLSGGEKALTAISLIFSIFLINPSPICILDEVDAALDEPNVEKFCNLLLELKKETKTRFLIITHHKVTMTSIDRVYGITMAQKGISDIVSVDFEKINFREAV